MKQLIADMVEVNIANKGRYANTFADITNSSWFASPRIVASHKDYQLEGRMSIPQASRLATSIRNYLRDNNDSKYYGNLICAEPNGFRVYQGIEVIPFTNWNNPTILIQNKDWLSEIEKTLGEAIREIQTTSPSVSALF